MITTDEEDQLWESGVLNVTTPRGLQNAVFFTIGKLFCLCGGKEHRALKLSQLKRDSNVDKYIYTTRMHQRTEIAVLSSFMFAARWYLSIHVRRLAVGVLCTC